MSALARGMYLVRRRLGERLATFVVLGTWATLAIGVLSSAALVQGDLAATSVLAVVAATLVWTVSRELGFDAAAPRAALRELELGLVLTTALYVLLALTGGARSFLHPLVYALVSFLVIVARSGWTTAVVLCAAVGLELLLALQAPAARAWASFGQHVSFIAFFAAGNRLVLVGVVRRLRREHAARVQGEIGRMRQEARDFRLIASQLPLESRTRSRDEEELRMAVASVESIHEQLFHALDLLRSALGLHTCALLWCEDPPPGGRSIAQLSMKELSTASELVVDTRLLPSPGLLTAVLADPKPLRLHALAGRRLPPYYAGPEPVTDLCAVPLMDGGTLRGILCADRTGDRQFTDDDERVLGQAATQLRRVIEHERAFLAVERGKYEQEQFYRASDMLASALELESVYEKTFAAVRAIAPYDLAVVTGGDAREHTVLAVDAPGGALGPWPEVAEQLRGLRFSDPHSLVAMAIKNRHYMPASGDLVDEDTIVWSARTKLRGLRSLLVLPLLRGDEVLGTVALAAARPGVFGAMTR
jgi:GAF domain-containing protein